MSNSTPGFRIQSTDVILATATGGQLQLGLQRPAEMVLHCLLWGHSYVMQFLQCSDGKPLRASRKNVLNVDLSWSIYSFFFFFFFFFFWLSIYVGNSYILMSHIRTPLQGVVKESRQPRDRLAVEDLSIFLLPHKTKTSVIWISWKTGQHGTSYLLKWMRTGGTHMT